MEEYRTDEQFQEIMDSCMNGNWGQASDECVEYGFYANDLVSKWEVFGEDYGYDLSDLVHLAEGAAERRYK